MCLEVLPGIQRRWQSDNFDSELYLDKVAAARNADLILDVRVYFCRINPPAFVTDTTGTRQPVLSWGADWDGWVGRCQRAIENRLNNKLWLVPSDDWGVRLATPETDYRPNIKCGLRIHPVGAGDRYHLRLDCYRVTPNFCPLTPAAAATAAIYRSYMQGNYGRIVNVDAWSCATHGTETHRQEVAAHEFGHFLGYDHVGVGGALCPTPGNGLACYGTTPYQRDDLMGWGDRVEEWHAFPWVGRLTRHLIFSVPWSVTRVRPAPACVRASPRPAPAGR
jgi:hypothetical protein